MGEAARIMYVDEEDGNGPSAGASKYGLCFARVAEYGVHGHRRSMYVVRESDIGKAGGNPY